MISCFVREILLFYSVEKQREKKREFLCRLMPFFLRIVGGRKGSQLAFGVCLATQDSKRKDGVNIMILSSKIWDLRKKRVRLISNK